MELTRFEKAIALIDKKNSEDIHKEVVNGIEYPKELLYSQRMTQKLLEFEPNASQELQIAARAQHICRWKIARDEYPMAKVGYLKWRETLKRMHADLTAAILSEVGYHAKFIERVSFLILKKRIKKDLESQQLEDVVCLVFLEHYFEDFASKHKEEKVVDIVQKTWGKMSDKGHQAALNLNYSDKSLTLIKHAIG